MSNFLYNLIFKKSSTFTVVILTGAFFFERALDMASDKIFYAVNKGILHKKKYNIKYKLLFLFYKLYDVLIALWKRLWKDIEPQYLQK